MDKNEALRWVDEQVVAKSGRQLNQKERVVLSAAWDDIDYEKTASNLGYSSSDLNRNVGRLLWPTLTAVLGSGEKVTKKRFRSIVERAIADKAKALPDSKPQSSIREARPMLLGQTPPNVSCFWGRIQELKDLSQLVLAQRIIGITGVKGIGKSAVAAKLVEAVLVQPQPAFERVIWQSLCFCPSLQELVDTLLELLTTQSNVDSALPESPQARVARLVECLKQSPCLIVLDGAEAVLVSQAEQVKEYELFLRRIAEEPHQSCLLLTTQLPFQFLTKLQNLKRPVSLIKLEGLKDKDAAKILKAKRLSDKERWIDLIKGYQGNPLALELAATRIQALFGGHIVQEFLDHKTSLANDPFQGFMNQQFGGNGRLNPIEQRVLVYLAQKLGSGSRQIPVTQLLNELSVQANPSISLSELVKALEALEARALIGPSNSIPAGETGPSFTLNRIVQQYILKDPFGLVSASLDQPSTFPPPGVQCELLH